MASDLEIVNSALSRIGVAPISAIGENTEAGLLAQNTYANYRDILLQSHPWKFAPRSVKLSDLFTPTPAGWSQAFKLPVDCLRPLEIKDLGKDNFWDVEDGGSGFEVLVIDYTATAIDIRYIRRIEASGRFSAGFTEALMQKLAAEWAEPLTSSNTLHDRMEQKEDRVIRTARSYEGQQGTPQVVRHYSWIQER